MSCCLRCGIRGESAIVGDRKGSCYKLGVMRERRAKREREHKREQGEPRDA